MLFFEKNRGKNIKDMVYYIYKKIGNRKGDSMKNFDDLFDDDFDVDDIEAVDNAE